jgi:cation:H+ antiporter
LTDWLYILTGLVALFFGGEFLVKGSGALALRLGVSPLVAGLTVVAFGTSSPELLVSLQATLKGEGALAVGNVVGSNIFNIGFILGLTALIFPLRVQLQILRFDAPVMIGLSLLLLWILADGAVSRAEGGMLLAGLVTYVIATVRIARRQGENAEVTAEFEESVPKPSGTAARDLGLIVGGLVLLAVGSRLLVAGAVSIARALEVPEAIIGLTIVAAGTSLPEVAASLVAALKKEPDIALGNIVGSNIFNILGILGISAVVRPLAAPGIGAVDLWMMIAFALGLALTILTARRLDRWEGGVLLLGYCGYVGHLIGKA